MEKVHPAGNLDMVLEQGEKELGLTPGARSAFDFAQSRGGNEYATRTDARAMETFIADVGARESREAERKFQLARDVSEAARKDEAIRTRAPFLYGRPRRRGWALTQRSGRARYRNR